MPVRAVNRQSTVVNPSLLLAALIVLIASVFRVWPLFLVYSALVAAAAVVSPVYGAALWYMLIPFEAVTSTLAGFSPFTAVTPALLGGCVIHAMSRRTYRFPILVLILSSAYVLNAVLSGISGHNTVDLRALVGVCLLAVCVVVSFVAVHNEPEKAHAVLTATIVSALAASLYGLLIWQQHGHWRLSMTGGWGGGVRYLDSSITIALAVCLGLLLEHSIFPKRSRTVSQAVPFMSRLYLTALMLIFSALLLATLSRGSIVAIIAGIFVFLASRLCKTMPALFVTGKIAKNATWMLLPLFVLVVVVMLVLPVLETHLTRGQIADRATAMIEEPLSDGRFRIWSRALAAMQGADWIIGTGVGTFRSLTGWSPHGAFHGALVEMGVLGLLLVMLPVIVLTTLAVNKRAISVLIFMVVYFVMFLTKGSLFDKFFYFGPVIAYSMLFAAVSSNRH